MLINVYIELDALNQTFTYRCDEQVAVGARVKVELGKRDFIGIVEAINVHSDLENIKKVKEVIDHKSLLNDELFGLADMMQKMYLCSKISCYKAMLPPALKPSSSMKKIIYEDWIEYVKDDPKLTLKQSAYLHSYVYPLRASEFRKESKSIASALINKQCVKIVSKPKQNNDTYEDIDDVYHELTSEQQNAIDIIENTNKDVFLLHGVTGSGKTEVFLRLADKILSNNKQVLFLVPEIGLTPMMIKRVQARFKKRIAIYHSRLNATEKYEQYQLVKDHKVDIVVGTRSACFMPFSNLGLILMDEEHDNSYKQDNTPSYHTRDIVLLRAKYHHCKVVLASATPSLESYARAYKNVYQLVELKQRINELPDIHLIDMRNEETHNGFSMSLLNAIYKRLKNHEQVILLLNRRGYLPVVKCLDCGTVRTCPDCGIALSYHKSNNMLMCHSCSRLFPFDDQCPNCHSKAFSRIGMGTEKLEEQIANLFPQAKIVRMDSDTTASKSAHQKLLQRFEKDGDILVGTQMVAKGLDFARVTLVGIINADSALVRSDYHAAETAYEMLEQASGRSGRGKLKGEVYIQTFDPDHYVIQCVYKHDYHAFFQKEMQYRHLGMYPPYIYICNLVFVHKNLQKAMEQANEAKNHLKGCIVLGPVEIHMQQKFRRVRLIVKNRDDVMLHQIINDYLNNTKSLVRINMHPTYMED